MIFAGNGFDIDWRIGPTGAFSFAPMTPPPLPVSQSPSLEEIDQRLAAPIMDGGKPFPGTEGMTLGEVEAEVLSGGRFLAFSWTLSVVIMSFRRSSDFRFFRAREMSGTRAFGYGVMTLLLGWWGFPWGLIYTPASLVRNARGGYDQTAPIMGLLVGEERAREVMLAASPRKADGMLWAFRGLLVAFAGFIGYFIYLVFTA